MDLSIREHCKVQAKFVGLTRQDQLAAHAAWQVIHPLMPMLLDKFYEHLDANGLHHIFRGKSISTIKSKQIEYWEQLFSGNVDRTYDLQVSALAAKHQAVGVDLSHYIGSYAWFSQRFFQIIADCRPVPEFGKNQMLTAVNKLIYLDMMLAQDSFSIVMLDI